MSMFRWSSDIIVTDLGDELILLDPERGEMFGLNECGRRVWLSLEQASGGVVSNIAEDFRIEPARARADVDSLLSVLEHAGLIRRVDDDVDANAAAPAVHVAGSQGDE